MSVYIFGDTHAVIDTAKLSARQFPESKRLTENDYVIICGDFGFPFLPSDILPESEKTRIAIFGPAAEHTGTGWTGLPVNHLTSFS